MFIAHASRTMANAKFRLTKPLEPDVAKETEAVRIAAQRAKAAAEKKAEEDRLDAVIAATVSKYREIVPSRTETAREIVARIAKARGVKPGEILGPRRDRHLCAARFEAIRAVADAKPGMSMPAIGRVFGRDHTTILHALKKTKRPDQRR